MLSTVYDDHSLFEAIFLRLVIYHLWYRFSIDTEVLHSGIVPKPKLWYRAIPIIHVFQLYNYYRHNLRHHISGLFDHKKNAIRIIVVIKRKKKIALYVVHTHVHNLIARYALIWTDIHTDCC